MDILFMIRSNLFYSRFINGGAHVNFYNTAVKVL